MAFRTLHDQRLEASAPLDDFGAHVGIRSLWASKAGFDGRPPNQPGHIDD